MITRTTVTMTTVIMWIVVYNRGSDPANFVFKTDPELAAGKYRISLKSKLPHLASILDVILWPDIEAGTDLVTSNLDGFKRPSNFDSRWLWRSSRFDFRW